MSDHTKDIIFFGSILLLIFFGFIVKRKDVELVVDGPKATFHSPPEMRIVAFLHSLFFFGWMILNVKFLPHATAADRVLVIASCLFPLALGLMMLQASCNTEMEIDLEARTYRHTTRWLFGSSETKTGFLHDFEGVCSNSSRGRGVFLLLRHRKGNEFGYSVGHYQNPRTAAQARETIAVVLTLPLVMAPWDRRPWNNR